MGVVNLILSEAVAKLGEAGDLVSVRPGYARNFLLPQGKAMLATDARVKEFAHKKQVIADKLAKQLKDLDAARKRIEGTVLEFSAQAGEEGKLFGSITAQQIADQLAEKGVEIDRRKLTLDDTIKSVGEHKVSIRLRADVVAEVKVIVTAAD